MDHGTVLVVDDDAAVRDVVAETLSMYGYRVMSAESAEQALELLDTTPVDLVLTDVHMPGMNGVQLCARLKNDARFQLTPVVLLTAVSDLDARVAGLAAGADDFFAKPCEFVELRARAAALIRMKSLVDQLEKAEGVITALGLTIEARDPYTGGHCERLAGYAVAVGRALKLDDATLRALHIGGFLHDLGKIAVADHILLKPGPLDLEERARIRVHPVLGADLVRGMRTLDAVRPIIRHHHERFDGSGYPDGLAADAIPLGARVMSVVDVYDALVTERPYKPALSTPDALAILQRETDAGAWDPAVVTALLDVARSG